MLGNAEQDAFISAHRWAVITTLRRDGSASSSVVAYAREGDTLVVSTPGDRLKAKTLQRDPRVTLCIISNAEPFNYVTVEGEVDIEREQLEGPTRAVFANIADTGFKLPDDLPGWLASQGRVILRIKAGRIHGVIR